jgi:lipoprotein NlpD
MKSFLSIAAFGITLLFAGCASTPQAPVIERTPRGKKPEAPIPVVSPTAKAASAVGESDQRPDIYTVKKGDTLYGIGLEYGFDYKEIAQHNDIPPPYVIRVGQQLKLPKADAAKPSVDAVIVTPLPKPESPVTAKLSGEVPLFSEPKVTKEPYSVQAMAAGKVTEIVPKQPVKSTEMEKPAETAKIEPAKAEIPSGIGTQPTGNDESVEWAWPTNGKVVSGFNESASAKGIDIGGMAGQAVHAAAQGKVVYSGSGLRGYGKLIIIKHNKTYLSAYAHNSLILVKEGQEIIKGQKIAEMGKTDTDAVKLHFEIRRLGKPVDPIKYLPASN